MPEEEIKITTKCQGLNQKVENAYCLRFWLFFFDCFDFSEQVFSAIGTKDKEPEFNYAPIYNPAYSGAELEISALSYLGAYLGEDGKPMILAEKTRKICYRWPASPS